MRALRWYARLLRLFPKDHRAAFGESMQQTFNDLYRERRAAGRATSGFIAWVFAETAAGAFRENMMAMNGIQREFVRAGAVTAAVLAFPLVLTISNANSHFNGGGGGGWDWGPGDFLVMGVMLMAVGLGVQFVVRKLTRPLHRVLAAIGIVAVFLVVWTELAVGAVSQLIGLAV